MSETWGFKCLVCDKESEDGLNHGDEILLNILRHIDVIKMLLDSDKYGYLEISIMGRGTEPISFLMEHYGEGHELVVKSEYGKIKKVDEVVHKELLIDVMATLQENSVAANKVKKDLSDIGQLTKFREMELETIIEGSEATINDIENSLKNTKMVSNKIDDNIVSKIIKHLEILRNAQKATTGLPNEELDNLIVYLKTKR